MRELLEAFRWTGGHADFSQVFADPAVLAALGPALAEPFASDRPTAVIALEARGFVLGALAATELGVGLVLARKPGSIHPNAQTETAATPDWRNRIIDVRISRTAVKRTDRLLLVDDWIETGSQARTVATLLQRMGASLVGVSVLVDDTTDVVRTELNVHGVVRSSQLPTPPPTERVRKDAAVDLNDLNLDRMLKANEAYASSASRPIHSPRPTKHLLLLTCMDARLDLFRAFGLWQGDAHILRNAGGRASTDAIRSLVLSSHHLGTREFGVIHHTDCGLFHTTNEAIAAKVADGGGGDASHIDFMPFDDVAASVIEDVQAIKDCGLLPADGVVWGGVFDVDEGTLDVIIPPTPLG